MNDKTSNYCDYCNCLWKGAKERCIICDRPTTVVKGEDENKYKLMKR